MTVGEKIGPFSIEREVGSGAMGTVYQARYEKTGQTVALKIIAFGLISNETALARFQREGEILKQLRHRNIVRLFATGRYRQTPFFAMEFIDGESLDRIQSRRERFGWEEVVQLGVQLCDALQHAHEKGIIHRDLKPSNLMVDREGTLKLTDFGIAKDMDVTALTGANSTIGTAAYMSPEQCRGERDLSHKSDLYSLGVVFYELLTGRKPFTAESAVDLFMLHVKGKFERPGRLVQEIPVWLDTLVCQLLEKKPEHRPLDAAMVRGVLLEVRDKAEQKRSVGREVAAEAAAEPATVARKKLTEEDKEAARAMRAGAARKKARPKSEPFYRRVWFQALSVTAVLAGAFALLYLMTRPESADVMLARVREARDALDRDGWGDGERRRALIRRAGEYLTVYGDPGGPDADDVREYQLKAQRWEVEWALLDWARERRRIKPQRYEEISPGAFEASVAALKAEEEGDVGGAAGLLAEAAEALPADPADPETAAWADLARLRPRQADEARRHLERLTRRVQEGESAAARQGPEGRALRALRFELEVEDYHRAWEAWRELADDIADDLSLRPWYLLAVMKARQLQETRRAHEDDPAARPGRIRELLDEARRAAGGQARAQAAEDVRAVVELYAGDRDPAARSLAEIDAARLLRQLADG